MGLPISAYIAAACLLAVASCELPVFQDVNLPCYRLTAETVTPTKYDVDLIFSSLDSDVYEGRVDISLDIREADLDQSPLTGKICRMTGALDEIVLHADESLEIRKIQLTNQIVFMMSALNLYRNREIKELSRDRDKQLIKIKLDHELNRHSKAKLRIWFRGRMRDDKHGIYVSRYNDGSQVDKTIVAQFKPTFARTAFPCFDEPRFRVPLNLTLHHPAGLTAYGNTDGQYEHKGTELAITKFEESPAIPLHMAGFTVGQFDEPLEIELSPLIDDKVRAKPVKVRVITAPGERSKGEFALKMANKSLEWFESYIDYPFPMDKLDIIAIADLDKDNAESWGLAFIRDTNLWIDDETKEETRITTAVNVAHVVVHQWFGNLISVAEWQDIWITEGVAAQMAFKFVEEFHLRESAFFVRIGILSSVMQADQTGKMHALSPPEEDLLTSSQIYGIFDTLEFMKSASFAQMVSESLGESEYRRRLQQLVTEYAHRTIFHIDYMEKISPEDVEAITSFVDDSGLPVVEVNIVGVSLHFSIEPYNTSDEIFGSGSMQSKLRIYTYSGFFMDGKEELKVGYCIDNSDDGLSISTPEWFLGKSFEGYSILFKGRVFFKFSLEPSISAYFRTRYSDDLFEMLVDAVRQKWLGPMDRIQLLDDANNLVQDKLMSRENFANLVAAYTDETNSAVLIQLLAVNKTFASLGLESPLRQTFMNVFERHGFEVSGCETPLDQRALQDILKALVAQREERVVMAALEAFKKSDGGYSALFLREPVYAAVVQSGDKEQVQLLLKKLRNTQSYEEKIRLVTALAGSKDKRILTSVRNLLHRRGLKAETIWPFEGLMTATLPD